MLVLIFVKHSFIDFLALYHSYVAPIKIAPSAKSPIPMTHLENSEWFFFTKWDFAYLLTYSMEQSPSWDANRFAASQEILHILWKPKVHYRIHKFLPPILSWASSIQSIPQHPTSWRSILSSHLCLGLLIVLFPLSFSTKTLYTLLPPPYAPHAPPISFFSILPPAK